MNRHIVIVGSGTAGLINALMLRRAFPNFPITVVYSKEIGIVGVGEGSTEHWRMFINLCEIPVAELLVRTAATHKAGIRYKNWTDHTPDYFHSISTADPMNPFGALLLYNGLNADEKLLTNSLSTRGLVEGKVPADRPHDTINQFHFDTFKLNEYLTALCFQRNVRMVEGVVQSVSVSSEDGWVESVLLEDGQVVGGDFFVDASGFRRVVCSAVGNTDWVDYGDHLPMNSAIAFPTPHPEDGRIWGFTWARAMSNGWSWEIPTQERRGNGYVFCDAFTDEEGAVREMSEMLGYEVEPARTFRFRSGYLRDQWQKNVVAVGLSSSFVEPLEATSIGSTIQQARSLCLNLATFRRGDTAIQRRHNRDMTAMMENILSMIFLHYMTDRTDTDFWRSRHDVVPPKLLAELLELWRERPPTEKDVPTNGFEMFHAPHFWHVAQGQGLIPRDRSAQAVSSYGMQEAVSKEIWESKKRQTDHPMVDHLESLRALSR
jgi:tryptophan halogenase